MMEIAPFVIMLAIIFVIMFVFVFAHYQKSFRSFPPCSRLFAGSPLCASVTMLRATTDDDEYRGSVNITMVKKTRKLFRLKLKMKFLMAKLA